MNTICSFSSSQVSQPSHTLLCSTLVLSLEISILHLVLHLSFESLKCCRNPLHSPPSPALDYPPPHHPLKMPGWLLLPLSQLHRLLSACSPCQIPPRSSASSPCPSFPYHSQQHQKSTWRLKPKLGVISIFSFFLLFVQSWSSTCAMGLLSRSWLVSLLFFFFFSTFSKQFQNMFEKIKLHHSFLKDLKVLTVFLIGSNLLKVVLLILTWSCTALPLECPLLPADDEWVCCLNPIPFVMGRTPHHPLCTGHPGLSLLQNGRLIQPLDLCLALHSGNLWPPHPNINSNSR